MTTRAIVLDANILIRAVLGVKVSALIADYATSVNFLAPDIAYEEVQEHLPTILSARGASAGDLAAAHRALDALASVVTAVPSQSYEPSRVAALARIGRRDPYDWSVLACALQLGCPIWTEDRDFFGVGVPVWTTGTVGLYLSGEALEPARPAD
ncbi:MAG: PIN domain-containing protein [Betaproteobacteria bacterium]|nr:PIN domain-containing protein [Betaproteobacteria bacterium]